MVKLSIQDSEGRTTVVPLTDGELTIGRDPDNAICLTDRNVSRHHALLTTQGHQVWVENRQASWGTRLNKLLLRERTELAEGDILQIGDYVLEITSEDARKRDTALVDDGPTRSAGKGMDGATAMINLADIHAQMAQGPASTAIPEQAQPRLVVESDNLRGLELRVTKTPIVIGRVRENADLVVDHRSISKEHARLTRLPTGLWQILDLGSANGLKVNGEPYSKTDINTGDRIDLGHVTLRFLSAGAPAPSIENVGAPRRSKLPLVLGVSIAVGLLAALAVVTLGGKSRPAAADRLAAPEPTAAPTDQVTAPTPPAAPTPEAGAPSHAEVAPPSPPVEPTPAPAPEAAAPAGAESADTDAAKPGVAGAQDKPAPDRQAVDKHAAKPKAPDAATPGEPKAAAPEPKPAVAEPAPKSGADLYKDARDAQQNGKLDDAAALYAQAIKAGYGKAHKPLALLARDRNDKAGCVKHAKAYLEKNPSAGDADAMQQVLDKCSN